MIIMKIRGINTKRCSFKAVNRIKRLYKILGWYNLFAYKAVLRVMLNKFLTALHTAHPSRVSCGSRQ
jgi:hypothetical protein